MTLQVIDVHEELADAKVSAFHWRLGAIMGLLTLFDGYDTFNPAYTSPDHGASRRGRPAF
jgi:AAHS family 4-hydroxybenzoate transporter-like MFS transporter